MSANTSSVTAISTDKTVSPKDKTATPKAKKSNTWLWILFGVLAVIAIIIVVVIILAVTGVFSNSDETPTDPTTPNIPNDPAKFVYNTENSGGIPPFLVSTGPNYLTDRFYTTGSTNNPEILTQNAIGWVLTNNSPFNMFVYFYYVSPTSNTNIVQTNVPLNPESTVSWKSTYNDPNNNPPLNYSNIPLPFFPGMTFKFFQANDGVGVIQPLYSIPTTGINPDTDVILLRYNEDNSVTAAIVNSVTNVTTSINISSIS